MMLRPLLPALLLIFLCACADRRTPAEKAKEGASTAAEVYYNFLSSGDYDRFLAGRAGMEAIPRSYREQLLVALKQFMQQQQRAHGGITSVSVSNARIDSVQNVVEVFLVLHYGNEDEDSQEEIVVPMIEQDGQWLMK